MFWIWLLVVGGAGLWAWYELQVNNRVGRGFAGLLVAMIVFYAGVRSWCSGISEEHEAKKAAEEKRRQEELAEQHQRETRAAEERKALEKQKQEAAAKARQDALDRLGGLSAAQRLAALRKCFASEPECPDDPTLLIEAAANKAERTRLAAVHSALVKARDRALAPLRCCDGTDSPTCTCSGPRRGCCSHHGGVCGCSADP